MKFIYCYVLILLSLSYCFANDKILLSEVQTLTLYANRKTNGRRSAGVPQLECVGGTLNCDRRYVPSVVQCINSGKDEYDVQWTCKADLETTVKFGHIDVNCEGYAYPNDKYVLKGSCGLRYTLDGTASHNEHSRKHIHAKDKRSSDDGFNNLMIIILVIVVVVIIVCWYNTDNRQDVPRTAPSCPPPPGFRPEYTDTSNDFTNPPPYNSLFNKRTRREDADSGPGFWTGLGTGGVLGYMFGSNNQQRRYERVPTYAQTESTHYTEDYRERPRSKSPEFRTASGFGGTSRR